MFVCCVGRDREGQFAVGDVRAQTQACLDNIRALIEEAGGTMKRHRQMHGLCHRPRQLAADERSLFQEFRGRPAAPRVLHRLGPRRAGMPGRDRRHRLSRQGLMAARGIRGASVRCCVRCRSGRRASPQACPRAPSFSSWRDLASALALVFAGGFGAACSAASLARRRARSFSVLARVAAALASYSAIAFLPSSACRARISARILFGSSANGMPSSR